MRWRIWVTDSTQSPEYRGCSRIKGIAPVQTCSGVEVSHFATLLEGQSRTLLQRWLSSQSAHREADTPAPQHSEARLHQVMRGLVGALRGDPVEAPQLPHFGDDARAEVREYELLADVLLDVAVESDHALSPAELRVFNRFMMALAGRVVAVHALRRSDADRDSPFATRAQSEPAPQTRGTSRRPKLFETVVAGNWALDLVTSLVIADPALLALHHLEAGAPVKLDALRAAVHPEDRAEIEGVVQQALDPQTSGRYQLQYRVKAGPGEYRWVQTTGHALFEHGVPRQIVGTAIEVTQRMEAELAREGLFEALEAQPLVQVLVLEGREHVITMMNEEYRRNVADGRDLVGMPIWKAFPHLAAWEHSVTEVMEKGQPLVARNLPVPILLSEGTFEDRYFDFVMQPLRGRTGKIDGTLNLSLDVTTSVEARRSLEQFVDQEKDRAALERQLIGIVSHDLGNPIAAIKLSVRKLLDPKRPLEPGAEKLVHAMEITLEGVSRLVNDLLDFTLARQGTGLSIVRAPMNVHEAVRQSVEELRALFPHRELHFDHEGEGAGTWDRSRLSQITVNLVTNALKHGEPRAPVRVSTHGFADHVELRVWNAGEPIPEDLLPRLFEPMTRGREHPPELGRSVGLGLYIVRHIVDAVGGSISVTSKAEAGTTFVVSFPR